MGRVECNCRAEPHCQDEDKANSVVEVFFHAFM